MRWSILILSILTCSCSQYHIDIVAKPDIPEDFLRPVKTTPKQINLSREAVKDIEDSFTNHDDKMVFKFLLYNYYDSDYSLKMCNAKLITIDSYMKDYDKVVLGL
jgi:hypothetical protein